jgi:hypothetical protein
MGWIDTLSNKQRHWSPRFFSDCKSGKANRRIAVRQLLSNA